MFNIAIDVSPIYNGNSIRGVGYYTHNLATNLDKIIKTQPDFNNFSIDLVTSQSDIQKKHYDLIHYPYLDLFQSTLPFPSPAPFILTVHDLIPIEFSSNFPVGIKGNLIWQFQKFKARQSQNIITVSHYSKQIIHQHLKYPQDKIYITYLAADDSFKPLKDQQKFKSIRSKYQLPDKFVLYVGDANWNKNLPSLVDTCLQLNFPLVIVGSSITKPTPHHPWTKDIHYIQDVYRQLGGPGNLKLILTGFVPDEDFAYFYNLASIYCQPSRAEGFGLPLVQAMQSGCPVVYADRGAMAEIMDYSGVMFNPDNPTSLKNALNRLWNQDNLRQECIKKGLSRSQIFNWSNTALQTLAVYQIALINEKK